MTVKELMEKLAKMDPEMKVCFPDTYSRNEGWEDGCEKATLTVTVVMVEDGKIVLDGEDDWEEE